MPPPARPPAWGRRVMTRMVPRWAPWVVICGCLTLAVGLPAVIVLGEQSPMYYENVPFPVLHPPVVAGSEVALLVDRCNTTSAPLAYSFVRTLVPVDPADGLRQLPITLPPGGSLIPPGCEHVESQLNAIPATIPPGRYRIEAITLVQGHWRSFSLPWATAEFDVVAP